MRNIILSIVLTCMSVIAYAEPVSKSLSTDVLDVACMPGDAVCDVILAHGQTLNIEFTSLTTYLSVDTSAKFVFDDGTFRYNEKGEVVSLSPTKFSGSPAQTQQPVVQQAATPPYKLVISRETNALAIKTLSLTNSLTIQDISINEGNCPVVSKLNLAPKMIKMGEYALVSTYSNCNIVKIDVITNQGSWSHTIQ